MDFYALEPQIRTVALVGRFLQGWAILEHSLNKTIGKTLGLNGLQELIVTRNISVRDKIQIARTIITLVQYSHVPRDLRERADKVLGQLLNYTPVRNMMAHDMFMPTEDGKGVSFYVVKAKGELKIPDEEWSIEKFWEAFIKLNAWDDVIRELNAQITALPAGAASTGLLSGLSSLSLLSNQPPDTPDSSPLSAKTETPSQTLPEQKGK